MSILDPSMNENTMKEAVMNIYIGGTVFFKPGEYNIDFSFFLYNDNKVDNITFKGLGATPDDPVIYADEDLNFTGYCYCTVENLKLVGIDYQYGDYDAGTIYRNCIIKTAVDRCPSFYYDVH